MYDKAKFKACVDWYKANRNSLLNRYRGQYVVCTADSVLGAWKDMDFAIANAIDKGLTPGMFMVHKCVPPEEEEVAYYHSPRVDFSRTAL